MNRHITLSRGEKGLEIQGMYSGIPEGTRLTVPSDCTAYCIESHTKILSGKSRRVDFAGGIRIRYGASPEVEYAASGLLIIPSGYAAKPAQRRKITVKPVYAPEPAPIPAVKIKTSGLEDFHSRIPLCTANASLWLVYIASIRYRREKYTQQLDSSPQLKQEVSARMFVMILSLSS